MRRVRKLFSRAKDIRHAAPGRNRLQRRSGIGSWPGPARRSRTEAPAGSNQSAGARPKTSLAPGSRVVSDYLTKTGLQSYLDQLGFNLVGYGCTTCIGNSGPLHPKIEKAIHDYDLVAASVLSGNRNFEARVHQNIKANFLMSPPLVVAFALAGRVDLDLTKEPIGKDKNGKETFLRDLCPGLKDVRDAMQSALTPEVFRRLYRDFADQACGTPP